MINVSITVAGETIERVHITGHANSNVRGKDLVCAGVSSIAVGMLNALDTLAKDTCNLQMRDSDIKITVLNNTKMTQTLLNTLYIQLQSVEQEYSEYIHIEKVEV